MDIAGAEGDAVLVGLVGLLDGLGDEVVVVELARLRVQSPRRGASGFGRARPFVRQSYLVTCTTTAVSTACSAPALSIPVTVQLLSNSTVFPVSEL